MGGIASMEPRDDRQRSRTMSGAVAELTRSWRSRVIVASIAIVDAVWLVTRPPPFDSGFDFAIRALPLVLVVLALVPHREAIAWGKAVCAVLFGATIALLVLLEVGWLDRGPSGPDRVTDGLWLIAVIALCVGWRTSSWWWSRHHISDGHRSN